ARAPRWRRWCASHSRSRRCSRAAARAARDRWRSRAEDTDMDDQHDDRYVGTPRWNRMTDRAWDLSRLAQRFVHDRPLQAIALTIGVGFVVGKILSGREH